MGLGLRIGGALLFISVAVFIMIFGLYFASSQNLSDLLRNNAQRQTTELMFTFDTTMDTVVSDLSYLAFHPNIVDYLSTAQEDNYFDAAIVADLEVHRQYMQEHFGSAILESIVLVDADGIPIAYVGDHNVLDHSGATWFAFTRTSGSYVGISGDTLSSSSTLHIALKVVDSEGTFQGIIYAELDGLLVDDILHSITAQASQFNFALVTDSGIAASTDDVTETRRVIDLTEEVVASELSVDNMYVTFAKTQSEYLPNDWRLYSYASEDDVFFVIDRLRTFVAALFIALFGINLIVGWTIYVSLTRPIKHIEDFARQIDAGAIENLELKTTDNEIAKAFTTLAGKLSEFRAKLVTIESEKSKDLRNAVDEATKKLQDKINEEERTSKAMLYMLEDMDEVNKELKSTKADLELEKDSVQQKIVERTNELQTEKEKVEHLLKMKTDFVNQLSHDLRTPLTPMLTLLPLIEKEVTDETTLKDLKVVSKNAVYLKNLVIDTLNLARLDSGTQEFHLESFAIYDVFTEVLEESKSVLEQGKKRIAIECSPDIMVYADPLRVREILENLQNNALKFMDDGDILTYRAKQLDDLVEITVYDTGIGIDPEKVHHIFDEFYKADDSRHEVGSSGLGLTICKRLVENLGGTIRVESEGLGKGTSFIFTLPVSKSS